MSSGDTIKSPGTLVISTYAPCPDVRCKITPDLKARGLEESCHLLWINIEQRFRLGGSALAQAYSQVGDDTPDIQKPEVLKKAFNVTQSLIAEGKLLSGHDISDGGLIVCLLEMAFAGVCGIKVDLQSAINKIGTEYFATNNLRAEFAPIVALFAEEAGWVLEVLSDNLYDVKTAFDSAGVPCLYIGESRIEQHVKITNGVSVLLEGDTRTYFKQWERTSFELERFQANVECAKEEFSTYDYRNGPEYVCPSDPDKYPTFLKIPSDRSICVAVIREEGTNGDREMIAALLESKFTVHDVVMTDLLAGKVTLDRYRGVVFPGGFSYADTLGSAKGTILSTTTKYVDKSKP